MAKRFFDGPQTISVPKGKKQLFVRVRNVKRFNQVNGSGYFKMETVVKGDKGKSKRILTASDWEASVDGIYWTPVRINRSGAGEAPRLQSVWLNERWNPLYNGIKYRYFRKRFRLGFQPRKVSWKIFAPGNYSLQVNRKPVHDASEFQVALKRGSNRITVIISRPGYRKHFYRAGRFKVKNRRVFLRQKQMHRSGFTRGEAPAKPLITDCKDNPLAYSSRIDGKWRRFYAPGVRDELLSFMGNPSEGVMGLEQVFAALYRKDKIAKIRLTIDKQWQSIALKALERLLYANREKETSQPEYIALESKWKRVRNRLEDTRKKLAGTEGQPRRKIMEKIIRLQDEMAEISKEMDLIKNHFYEASVVLMNPRGKIRVAAYYPYNEETMKNLNPGLEKPYRPRENPYYNRCWNWKYNPGSTAKIMDSIAFLVSKDARDAGGRYRFPHLRSLLKPGGSFRVPRSDIKGAGMMNGKFINFHLRNFQGHNMPAGSCSIRQALAHSYNTYFSYLALHNQYVITNDSMIRERRVQFISKGNIPISLSYNEYPLLEMGEKLLMNRPIDLLNNLRGTALYPDLIRLPNDAFMAVASRFPVNAYTVANIAHYSIGQGDFQLTTLQNAVIVSSVLNFGQLYRPSIIESVSLKDGNAIVRDSRQGSDSQHVEGTSPRMGVPGNRPDTERGNPLFTGEIISPEPGRDKVRVFSTDVAMQVKDGMQEVVARGTGGGLFRKLRDGRRFFAKTGTAETGVYKDNSLFTGFVIFKNGKSMTFSVIVPRSGLGARVAGKLADTIISEIIAYENKKGGNF
ncbi:MAG: hypothetical protein GY765_40970 [bacterium]|nr:hypothetical protein [bacterium]